MHIMHVFVYIPTNYLCASQSFPQHMENCKGNGFEWCYSRLAAPEVAALHKYILYFASGNKKIEAKTGIKPNIRHKPEQPS